MSGIINLLYDLNNNWPETFILFAASGTLLVVNAKTGKVVETLPDIACDGGDPDFIYDNYGNVYIKHLKP